jgi:hypothetical protein
VNWIETREVQFLVWVRERSKRTIVKGKESNVLEFLRKVHNWRQFDYAVTVLSELCKGKISNLLGSTASAR